MLDLRAFPVGIHAHHLLQRPCRAWTKECKLFCLNTGQWWACLHRCQGLRMSS